MGQVSLLEIPSTAPGGVGDYTVVDRLPYFVGGHEVRLLCATKPPRRWFSLRLARSASRLVRLETNSAVERSEGHRMSQYLFRSAG